MTNDHNRTQQRTLGAYYTAQLTVNYIVEQTLPYLKKNSKILDPSAGDGYFLNRFKEYGVKSEQLYAYDINPHAIEKLKKITPFAIQKDTLQELEGTYDIIVGNPPYSSNECDYIKQFREKLRKDFFPVPPSNLYSLFCLQSLRHLKEGGVMSVIILDSFISNTYYKYFRETLLQDCKIKEILLAPRTLFHKMDADVRTAILTVEKCSGLEKIDERNNNEVRLVERVDTEEEYWKPAYVQVVKQKEFFKMPDSTFFINIPKKIIDLIIDSKTTLEQVLGGGTGISTGNDNKFLKRANEVKDNTKWVGYYKNGIRGAYYYEPTMFIEKDYKKNADKVPNYLLRNKRFFFKEGITCSSVGVNFSASYMPAGNLFGVNANFFTDDKVELYYALGLLNSKIAKYILKAIFNRTNNISSKYIKRLPYFTPDLKMKKHISKKVKNIVDNLKKNRDYDFTETQKELDEEFFRIYGTGEKDKIIIERFVSDTYNRL